jgi:hypothetical protein
LIYTNHERRSTGHALGKLVKDAPADLIGIHGNPLEQFKALEYPELVVSGGVAVVEPADD